MLEDNVFITGGAGFLGRGIMRRASREGWPCHFTIYSRDEQIQAQCRERFPSARYILGDVRDGERLALAMAGHRYVIHAAAMKFIPEGELNAAECVSVNVDGARAVIGAARVAGVYRVVGISTDKAAQPINIYGMTKAVMERLFAAQAMLSPRGTWPIFTTCRYGNVIGSTGSVVPVMRRQFAEHTEVCITDPDMTRFWMSIDDAVETVLYALAAPNGVIVVPNPQSADMYTVAWAVLGSMDVSMDHMGPEGEYDTRIRIIGRRPGEKQHEDLISHYELFRTEKSNGYFHIMPPGNEDYTQDAPTLSSMSATKILREEFCKLIKDSTNV